MQVWTPFRARFLERGRTDFEHGLRQRIQPAAREGRLTDEQADKILAEANGTAKRAEVIDQAA